ncbi:hypothetical protein BsWGS_21087 [Bradybaena similaris]
MWPTLGCQCGASRPLLQPSPPGSSDCSRLRRQPHEIVAKSRSRARWKVLPDLILCELLCEHKSCTLTVGTD